MQPSGIAKILERAEPWIKQCGTCDAGLSLDCVCQTGDPRPLISEMYGELAVLDEIYKLARPLSDMDSLIRHAEVQARMGDERGCGMTAAYSGPCGGCVDCVHAQVSYYFDIEKAQARVFHEAGLEWAPYVIDVALINKTTWRPQCRMDEKPKETT